MHRNILNMRSGKKNPATIIQMKQKVSGNMAMLPCEQCNVTMCNIILLHVMLHCDVTMW